MIDRPRASSGSWPSSRVTAPLTERIEPACVGEDHHAVHVGHHGTEHLGVALVEVEPMAIGDVAGDDHDQAGQGIVGSPARGTCLGTPGIATCRARCAPAA